MRRVRRAAAPLLLVAFALTGCTTAVPTGTGPSASTDVPSAGAPSSLDGDAVRGGTLRYALSTNPSSIDPRFLADDEGMTVADALFDSLVALGDDAQEILPAAAASWEVSGDGRTYTFQLRAGATYHDGTPVRAQDFVRSFRRIVDREARPTSFLHYQLAAVEGYEAAIDGRAPLGGVTAPDASTLRIRLAHPMAEFLQVLAHPSLAPIPPVADEARQRFAEAPVGNGPFQMAEPWQPNQFIRVSRYADHHAPPRLDEVVFQIFAGDPTREQQYADFERGQLDVAEVPPAELEAAESTYGRSDDGRTGPGLLTGLTGSLYALGFNTEVAPFDDPAVRRAVTLLVDRRRIVDEILLDARVPADTLVPPSLPGGQEGRCDLCRFDPDAARAELGYPDAGAGRQPSEEGTATDAVIDTPIEILVNEGTTNERIAQRVANDIEVVLGVEVTTRTAEPAEFVGEVRAGQVQLFRLGWQADYPSPGAVLQPLFRSDAIGADNLMRFADDEVDQLLDEARRTPDDAERLELYAAAERRVLELAPVAPVFFYRQNRVVAAGVRALRLSQLGGVNLDEAWKPETT